MVTGQATQQDSRSKDLQSDLRRQLRYEINGDDLKGPEKFALEQKFGLTDPALTSEEKQTIAAEEARLGR
jgi:hypothetical protein